MGEGNVTVNTGEGMLAWGRRVGIITDKDKPVGEGKNMTSEDLVTLRSLFVEHGGKIAS